MIYETTLGHGLGEAYRRACAGTDSLESSPTRERGPFVKMAEHHKDTV